MTLAAIDVGEGPVAVLLHGQPGGSGDWSAVIEELRGRMRLVVPDRPGYGRTGGPALGFESNANDLIQLLDQLDIERAVIAGHSWATGVVLAAAIRFPDRVQALVLASPVSPALPVGAIDRALAHPILGPPMTRAGFWLAGLSLSLPPLRRLARFTAPAADPEQVAATAEEWRSEAVWKSFYAEQRALIRELPSLAPRLASMEAPTTIVHGTGDRISPPAHSRQLAGLLPNATLATVDGAGHMLPLQRPDFIADAIANAAP